MTLDTIHGKIHTIRGMQVILDTDLATLYQVETKVLKQAVRRNIERFPKDFMFELTSEEYQSLRSQIVTLEKKKGAHSKYLSFAFTEQGVAMLSSVLKNACAKASAKAQSNGNPGKYSDHAGICIYSSIFLE